MQKQLSAFLSIVSDGTADAVIHLDKDPMTIIISEAPVGVGIVNFLKSPPISAIGTINFLPAGNGPVQSVNVAGNMLTITLTSDQANNFPSGSIAQLVLTVNF